MVFLIVQWIFVTVGLNLQPFGSTFVLFIAQGFQGSSKSCQILSVVLLHSEEQSKLPQGMRVVLQSSCLITPITHLQSRVFEITFSFSCLINFTGIQLSIQPKWIFLLLLLLTDVFPHLLSCIGSSNMSTGSIKVTELHQWSYNFFVQLVQYSVLSVS